MYKRQASYRFGVRPKEIGFGFYFVFPVFYTNVTGIWALSAPRRIIVNLAGIYFQLLINAGLIAMCCFHVLMAYMIPLILVNTVSMTVSLIPFFRYDGYWIYSDFFKIPNLQSKSGSILSILFLRPKSLGLRLKQATWPLLIYSFTGLLFWIYVYVMLFEYILTGGRAVVHVYFTHGFRFFGDAGMRNMLDTVVLLLTAYLFLFQILQVSKFLFYESRGVYQRKRAGIA